jgi:rhodanese-related sulfurtransferase
MTAPSVDPHEVWRLLQGGNARLLDLRTGVERRRYGPPESDPSVSRPPPAEMRPARNHAYLSTATIVGVTEDEFS